MSSFFSQNTPNISLRQCWVSGLGLLGPKRDLPIGSVEEVDILHDGNLLLQVTLVTLLMRGQIATGQQLGAVVLQHLVHGDLAVEGVGPVHGVHFRQNN